MKLSWGIENLGGVGEVYRRKLVRLEIRTIRDLLFYPPFRYNDLSLVSLMGKVQPGEVVTVQGEMAEIVNQRTWTGKWIQKGRVIDKTGEMGVTWFNRPFLVKLLKRKRVSLAGKVELSGREKGLTSPEYELVEKEGQAKPLHTGRLVPVYSETKGVSSRWLRTKIKKILAEVLPLEDYLPGKVQETEKLIGLSEAIYQVHFPDSLTAAVEAKRRLAFDELCLLHLASLKRHGEWQETVPTYALKIDGERVFAFLNQLPFELTGAQKRVIQEILTDLGKKVPMNRLLQGDVGSGKTVVAALAAFVAFVNGFQSILMAPTQILAAQHYQTLSEILSPLGVRVELLMAGKKKGGEADVWVGTHALIHKLPRSLDRGIPQAEKFVSRFHPRDKSRGIFAQNKRPSLDRVAVVIIDEQHKFGVEQRAHLVEKGRSPHVLTMTATPIPRTIALTVFGDLNLSVMDEMPPGRKPVKTRVVLPSKRQVAYKWIEEKIRKEGVQAFIVCPLIEESEVDTLKAVKAVTSEFLYLKNEVFPDLRLGLLHGRMNQKEKQAAVESLVGGKWDILVTTPVVEVGMDVPKASIMVVEAADRFGLAQLHQLRGRVGRRGQQGYCLLFAGGSSARSRARLSAMEKVNLGMELAEMDLSLRGPGEVYGLRQHGFTDLAFASFSDREMIERTRQAAETLAPELTNYPLLEKKVREKIETVSIEPN